MPDLLIELLSEEIPARMQIRAAEDLRRLVTDGLVEAGLTYAGARAFSTPRRLALTVQGLVGQSSTSREERKGPRTDAPDKALQGFLRSTGLRQDQLEARDDKKGQVWFAVIERPGRPASDIVADVLEATIRGFPWPKSMRWGAGTLRWVRPLHGILCLLSDEAGTQPVPLSIDGIVAGTTTRGHRFMAPAAINVRNSEDYEAKLKRACVILDANARAEAIWHEATTQAFAQGLDVIEDKGLLDEVAGLVEWPVVLMGEIGAAFLDLPPEVLQTSMREHQKFFSVRQPVGNDLANAPSVQARSRIVRFVTVANRETADHGATILAGNRKVLSARLADAKFFWENDLRTVARDGMSGLAAPLAEVTFHRKLGSQADRVARIETLAREIAPAVGADPEQAAEAARICKADLASEMVYEFPELQGVMGRYYAEAVGHAPEVAAACADHYAPLGPSDAVPTAPVSVAVALADKIDMLTGFWAIDEKPTGSKDPFALRRAALGVIRLVLENDLRLALFPILDELVRARKALDKPERDSEPKRKELDDRVAVVNLMEFFHDRLKPHLRDRDIPHDVIDACLAMPNADDLTLLVARAEALAAFLTTEDGTNLLQGFKRANNILTQAETADGVEYSFGAERKLAETDAERALFDALDARGPDIAAAVAAEDFAAAMASMAALRAPIDAFFDTVQVNAESQILRRNRLNLLSGIRTACSQVADLSRLDG